MNWFELPLTQGQVAKVDEADRELVSSFNWYASYNPHTRSFYVHCQRWVDGRKRTFQLHRVLLGLGFGDERQGDHENHDTLDNRRSNLRVTTPQGNSRNRRTRRDNRFGTGVFQDRNKFRAAIRVLGVRNNLGSFDTPEEASAAYQAALHSGE
jgi:hypothetical protein